jgi:hypothetical protein
MRPAHPTPSSPATSARRLIATAVTSALALTLLGTVDPADASAPATAAPATAAAAPAAANPAAVAARAARPNPVTPGHFSGYGFDQCLAPTQKAMDTWLTRSPYLAVGIYISGDSRACRRQPNLTPAWIRAQLAKGWRLLPITLGPQASCQPRFPRYDDDFKISPDPGADGAYQRARQMGRNSARETVADARALGIVAGSTLWYDLEGFDNSRTHCRESALAFLSAWTYQLHRLDYVSGVYSSAGSGILELDRARRQGRGDINLPDRIWLARWDGKANTSTDYIGERGWRPGNRVKQYLGGHDETWGGVRINIDSNRLDLGRGAAAYPEKHCGGVRTDYWTYQPLAPATRRYRPAPSRVKVLQCLLKEKGFYDDGIHGRYGPATIAAARAWQRAHRLPVSNRWSTPSWMSLFTDGTRPVLKFGVAGRDVRRLQRALNAASTDGGIGVTGLFDAATRARLRKYQDKIGMRANGILTAAVWNQLRVGRRW